MQLPETQGVPFSSIVADIEKGITKIPQFQREFVWQKDKSIRLLDSILKGFPIGAFIFWKTKEELRSVRDLGGIKLPSTPNDDYRMYVLDGQQRLTSLFASLKGLKIRRDDHEDDFSDCYIDLDANEHDPVVVSIREESDTGRYIQLNMLLLIPSSKK